ncbi:ChrR family anti-sigma-E factor [Anderseniella sp. Alg231-50]|uniref:ChrR family anti-sigma-E factor n=1 Tax=Anderseniella sp. Alg231-50 TaxID=1922226 RepID=UPI000D55EBD2
MNTVFHLDDATVVAYAGGSLSNCLSVVAASHVAMCDHCRAKVRTAEAVGAALLETSEKEQMSSDALSSVFERIDGSDWVQPKSRRDVSDDPDPSLPLPVSRLLDHKLDDVRWKTAGPGVGIHVIEKNPDGSSLYLLKVRPGHKLPDHGHAGQEMTLILRGAYRDQIGRFAPGDVADLDEDIEHQPVIEDGEDCICLIATEAPARFKGLVPRLLQPIVGI